jgi:hypothetical protein
MVVRGNTEDGDARMARLITEAQAWYSMKSPSSYAFNLATDLRTQALTPDVFSTNRRRMVESVTERRSQRLRRYGVALSGRPQMNGRLLGFEPDESLSDGAAEAASRGFFDSRNSPPWDLWVDLVVDVNTKECLVSWVPEELVEIISKSVAVNPEECIFWLPQMEARFLDGG